MPWGQPIELLSKDGHSRLIVTDIATALQWLRETRPSLPQASLHLAAIHACLVALDARAAPARALFIRAARASGLLVQTAHWHESETPLASPTGIKPGAFQPGIMPCKQSRSRPKR